MVIRSRPRSHRKRTGLLQAALLWRLRPWPRLRATVVARVERYNRLWINKHRAERQGALRCEKRSNPAMAGWL
jgi:hypothetical protein